MPRMTRRQMLAGAVTGGLTATPVFAAYPEKPILYLCPLPAGGLLDTHMRFLAEHAGRTLGQQVLVDCKPGATATLAATNILHAKPDGYSLATMMATSLRFPYYNDVNWDPLRDFTYIMGLSNIVIGIVVKADAPWRTIEDLIEAGRRTPEKLNYGTSGIGGTGHLTALEIERVSGLASPTCRSKAGLRPCRPYWAVTSTSCATVPPGRRMSTRASSACSRWRRRTA